MTDVDPRDLTARARIRDAALRHFGEQGFDRATIRGIAEIAGVSSGLLRHHYGSKEELRDACDAYLAETLAELNDRVRAADASDGVNYVAVAGAAFGPYQKYLSRALAEGRAQPIFDKMVELGGQWLEEMDAKRSDPPTVSRQARAAVSTAMSLSIGILHSHVSRHLGMDVFSPQGADVLVRVLLDLYSHPMLSPDEAAAHLARLDETARPGEEER
ncbi:TetR/AcrR family transcriptional regulator [Stackebrandtia nassauensis]|uniref:Transcriptional regulator, TetR family n=1 Tax=Stackebrandtia nassauensis (strain DSM 44728 / CIP 108903 / NRRL B-16338 / NBRC 102104 / LLR-40K-21) TaxID=446470 RepID=D3PUS6_STANL|nr:TetR/AcrR family transcriptional regulator [Stackebrandtia nassauensis]ADD44950.1 transcriptional regulator, TetR family [Stackebrandtia nassauensis DSM 44728]